MQFTTIFMLFTPRGLIELNVVSSKCNALHLKKYTVFSIEKTIIYKGMGL